MKAIFLKAARDDLNEAVQYYDAQRPGLGREFRGEVRSTIGRIKALPEAWASLSENTRRCRTRRFPYGVIYQSRLDGIVIVAVAHLHQNPGRWRDRL